MILSKKSMGNSVEFVVVDHNPTTTATDAYSGSFIVHLDEIIPFAKPTYYYKLDDGATTNVEKIITRDMWTGTVAPTVNDDVAVGFDAGSEWYDTLTGKVYKCVNPAIGAAVWVVLN